MTISLAYRRARPLDMRFVVESFVDSYRLAHAAGMISMDDWPRLMRAQWLKKLSRRRVEVWVAHHPREKDPVADLYGFLAVEKGLGGELDYVYYTYVKQDYRKNGIARGLFEAAQVTEPFRYAAKTPIVTELRTLGKMHPTSFWDPLTIRFPQKEIP